MAEVRTARGASRPDAGEDRRGFFARIVLFVRQVIDEMRKVVYPTRDELTSYTVAVLVFLAFIMAYVNGLDWLITRAVSWVFGSA